MPFPLQDRFKNLEEQFADSGSEPYGSHPHKPKNIPGIVIDYIARSDSGHCLKVIPFQIKKVTTAGEVTFTDGSSLLPSPLPTAYMRVFPIDVAPADVETAFTIGQAIEFFPYFAGGQFIQQVRGTFVCFSGAAPLPAGEIQFQSYQMGSNNQTVWDFARAHSMIG